MYHISDEFFEEVFQKLLRGQQRGLVQLLLSQIIVIMHRLQRNMKDSSQPNRKIPVNVNQNPNMSLKDKHVKCRYLCTHLVDVQLTR